MAHNINRIAESLFEKIRARFEKVSIADSSAKTTLDPRKARYLNFNFVDKEGATFGNVEISIADEESIKITYGKNITADLDDDQKEEWYRFLADMKNFAVRNRLKFTPHDISRSLTLGDRKQQATTAGPVSAVDAEIAESKLYGTTKTSYEKINPNTRLIIRHSGPVDETVHGARSRKIHAVYIEDVEGQRLKSPFTNLAGSRALARHISAGGSLGDSFSEHIVEMCEEMTKMRKFIQGSRNKTFEDSEANDMVSAAKERYQNIHKILGKLKTPRGYKFYKEGWAPSTTLQDDINLEELKGKFILKNFDERLGPALPYVQRAYQEMKNRPAVESHLEEFEENLEKIAEGSWALPDDELKVKKLQELMAEVLPAGVDGSNATGALYDVIGDDELFDKIHDASTGSPDTDVRPIIYDWLQANMPDVFEKVKANMESGGIDQNKPAPEEPTDPNAQPADEPSPQEQPQESADPLNDMRRLAGLRKN